MDVEECPSLIDEEDVRKQQTFAFQILKKQTTGLGEVTVHGGRKKVTGGDTNFTGLASEYVQFTPEIKEPEPHDFTAYMDNSPIDIWNN